MNYWLLNSSKWVFWIAPSHRWFKPEVVRLKWLVYFRVGGQCGGRWECALNFLSFPLCFSLQHPGVPMTPHIFLSHIFLPLGHNWNPVLSVQSNPWYVWEMRIFPSKHGMEVDLTIWWVSFVWQCDPPPSLWKILATFSHSCHMLCIRAFVKVVRKDHLKSKSLLDSFPISL